MGRHIRAKLNVFRMWIYKVQIRSINREMHNLSLRRKKAILKKLELEKQNPDFYTHTHQFKISDLKPVVEI